MAKERGFAFDATDARRIGKTVRRVESMPPRQPGRNTDTQYAIPVMIGKTTLASTQGSTTTFKQWYSTAVGSAPKASTTVLENVVDWLGTGIESSKVAFIFRAQRDGRLYYMADKGSVRGGTIQFSLPSSLAQTDASKAGCTVKNFAGGADPGATVTVFNSTAGGSNYFFFGPSGAIGFATFYEASSHYIMDQLECA